MPGLPTACCRSANALARFCAGRNGLERNWMPVLTSTPELHVDNYRFLQRHVYAETGIVLEEDKHYLFECRLVPIVRRLGLQTINDLCALLQGTQAGEVSRQVVEAMTTNETYFFR